MSGVGGQANGGMDQNSESVAPTNPPQAPAASLFSGCIDGLWQGALSGWAVTRDGAPCAVLVRVNGEEIGRANADQPRADLASNGKSKGLGGWRLPIAQALGEGENRIEALLPDGTPLQGSPISFAGKRDAPPAPKPSEGPLTFVGAIDVARPPVLSGWALSSRCEAVPVTLSLNDRSPIVIPSDQPRPDLAAQGLTPGDGGWEADISALLRPGINLIHLRFPNGGDLPGSPIRIDLPMPAAPAPPPPAPVQQSAPPQPDRLQASAPGTPAPAAASEPKPARPSKDAAPAAPGRISLAELDEISLDDLADAVAAGMISVPPPPKPPKEPKANEELKAPAPAEPEPRRRPGFLSRLLGRD